MPNSVLPRGVSAGTAVSPTGPMKSVTTFNGQTGAVNSSDIPGMSITYSQLQNEGAHSLLGNPTGFSVSPSEIALGTTLAFVGTNLETIALTGDVTSSANSFATSIASNAVTTAKINNAAVTYAKIQNESAHSLIGNPTGSSAAPSEITLGTQLQFSGTTLNTNGLSVTIITAALTTLGTQGSMTFTNGILVSSTPAT